MRIITLKIGEAGCLGSEIKLRVLATRGNSVQLGFDAPREVHIYRTELTLSSEKRLRQHDKRNNQKTE
ncbi:carbon storage regulator [Pseudomonas marginalis]|uniref:carbon storage regulator n=1 Tax=Pseudomonas marginalis TaxID=298 RepID=UPI003BA233E6